MVFVGLYVAEGAFLFPGAGLKGNQQINRGNILAGSSKKSDCLTAPIYLGLLLFRIWTQTQHLPFQTSLPE